MTIGFQEDASNTPLRRSEAGSAAAGGFGFQADATAFFLSHMLAGQSLGGLTPLLDSPPYAVAAETGGPGDDIRIDLIDGRVIEVQVKRRLQSGQGLWEALMALAQGVHRRTADFGLLIVGPRSSKTIVTALAKDVERLGDGRTDQLSATGALWRDRLSAAGLSLNVCAKLRIVVLTLTESESGDVRTAQALLGQILDDPADAVRAWGWLAADGHHLMSYRGRRTIETALRTLTSRNLVLRASDSSARPALLLDRLRRWTALVNENYAIAGVPTPLSIDRGWIEQSAAVLTNPGSDPKSFIDALEHYRAARPKLSREDAAMVHAATLGRFWTRCVVLAGPGMGKTTLLTKLARMYAADGYPVLKVRLRLLIERMRTVGETFEEALFALGCGSACKKDPVSGVIGV